MALIYNKKKVYYVVFVLKTISFFGELKKMLVEKILTKNPKENCFENIIIF